jgi:protein-tyrosine phosphatase
MKYILYLLFNLAHLWNRLFGKGGWQGSDRTEIVPRLYLGGFFTHWPEGMEVLNLAEENHYEPPLGREYHAAGRPDLPPAQTPEQLQFLANIVDGWLRLGRTVLVCCDLGRNRSALVVCALVVCMRHCSASAARKIVADLRGPVLHDWQFKALQEYEIWLGKPTTKNDYLTDF